MLEIAFESVIVLLYQTKLTVRVVQQKQTYTLAHILVYFSHTQLFSAK